MKEELSNCRNKSREKSTLLQIETQKRKVHGKIDTKKLGKEM